jgi:hypothetical protein
MLSVDLTPLLLPFLYAVRDPELATVAVLEVCCPRGLSNIGAKKTIAFSSCPVARALASNHSCNVIIRSLK